MPPFGLAESMIELSHEEYDPDLALPRPSHVRLIFPVFILLAAIAAGSTAFWLYGGGLPWASAPHQDSSTDLASVESQLQALQQDQAVQQAETKRLSDEVAALNGKFDALQQSFASAPVPIARATPPRKKPTAPAAPSARP